MEGFMRIVRKTIGRMLDEISDRHPRHDALIHTEEGIHYNYGLFRREVERAARGMIRVGIQKGDRVALWAPNISAWIIAQHALIKIGAVFIPVDPGAGPEDVRFILEQSECKAIVMARGLDDEAYVDAIRAVKGDVPSLESIFVVSNEPYPGLMTWTDLTALGDEVDPAVLREREKEVKPEDPVAIMYTSGTTGVPKGVVLDHLGLINKSLASAQRQGLHHEDRLCLFFPLFHMFGNTCIALAGFLIGATIVMPCLVFEPAKVLPVIDKQRCTALYGSPSMIIALLDHAEFKAKQWQTVSKGTLGGAPCPMELMKRLVQDVGVSAITVAYGITETASWITMTHPGDPLDLRVSTIGTPLECNRVKIADPVTGEDLPPNRQGELCIQGLLMKGYDKLPAATAAAIDRQGWFHSGDLGVMDEKGYVRITGRLKDVILRDGVEIYPAELEEVLYRIPEVSEVQVFGFPHPRKGQEVAAWVKLKQGTTLSLEDLTRYGEQNLPYGKTPRHFKFVSEFPMTRSGKVQKFKLAEMAEKEYL
jgi:fatty-acyl-CoA synthase